MKGITFIRKFNELSNVGKISAKYGGTSFTYGIFTFSEFFCLELFIL